MQTFLPYENFEESARALDSKRLGKQRVETWQVLRAIRGETKGWRNHPASVMWRGYEKALIIYGLTMCKEWKRRGYNDTMTARFEEELQKLNGPLEMPPWLGSSEFHISHQSNLLRKSEETYKALFPDVPADLPYVWPGEKSTVEEKIK